MHQTLTSIDGPLLGRVHHVKELIINHFRITIVVSYYFQKRNARNLKHNWGRYLRMLTNKKSRNNNSVVATLSIMIFLTTLQLQ